MNLSQDNRTPTGGRAGGDGIGAVANSPAHTVGAVGFGPAWTMEDSMAASIVRLEQENDELRAEVALLREEQKILAKGFPSPATAAVTEGGTGDSGAERPEPSSHLSETPETHEAVERWQQGKINIFDEMARLETQRDRYKSDVALITKERDEARKDADEWARSFCAVQVQRDEAREDAEHWKTEYEIVVSRLRGREHPRDNGIIADDEVIPRLTRERDSMERCLRLANLNADTFKQQRDEALWIIKQCLDCSRIMSAAKEGAK